jgi:hypothetical protein
LESGKAKRVRGYESCWERKSDISNGSQGGMGDGRIIWVMNLKWEWVLSGSQNRKTYNQSTYNKSNFSDTSMAYTSRNESSFGSHTK